MQTIILKSKFVWVVYMCKCAFENLTMRSSTLLISNWMAIQRVEWLEILVKYDL